MMPPIDTLAAKRVPPIHELRPFGATSLQALPAPLMPEGGGRPNRFPEKLCVLITARVHPGETPSSHVLRGLLRFLLRADDPRAIALRERFVFKLIPMLNPDGVFHGHTRSDLAGVNLNRKYASASFEAHPSVYASVAVARQLHSEGRLHLVVDVRCLDPPQRAQTLRAPCSSRAACVAEASDDFSGSRACWEAWMLLLRKPADLPAGASTGGAFLPFVCAKHTLAFAERLQFLRCW